MDNIYKYYRVLGLEQNASIIDIKKAYRECARRYHPDRNKSAEATEKFILATEAYQFLTGHKSRVIHKPERTSDYIKEWERYRREQARRRARSHARSGYNNFVNSELYRSTKILDKTRLFIGIAFSLLIIVLSINGYVQRLRLVDKGFEKPTLAGFLFLLFIGLLFLVTSLVFLYYNHIKKKPSTHYAKKNSKSTQS